MGRIDPLPTKNNADMMSNRQRLLVFTLALILSGCASRQDITRLEGDNIRMVCIIEHAAVRATTLDVIREGISRRGIGVRVVNGTYEFKHSSWIPRYQTTDIAGCDALLFYVAHWNWDLAYYMRFANIWMSDPAGARRLAQATYDASTNIGPGKFIVARDKLLELVDQMLAGVTPRAAATAVQNAAPPSGSAEGTNSDVKGRLLRLEELRKQGVVTEAEYAARRKAILEAL